MCSSYDRAEFSRRRYLADSVGRRGDESGNEEPNADDERSERNPQRQSLVTPVDGPLHPDDQADEHVANGEPVERAAPARQDRH